MQADQGSRKIKQEEKTGKQKHRRDTTVEVKLNTEHMTQEATPTFYTAALEIHFNWNPQQTELLYVTLHQAHKAAQQNDNYSTVPSAAAGYDGGVGVHSSREIQWIACTHTRKCTYSQHRFLHSTWTWKKFFTSFAIFIVMLLNFNNKKTIKKNRMKTNGAFSEMLSLN